MERSFQLVAVDVYVIEQTGEVVLALAALGGFLDAVERVFQRHVQVFIALGLGAHILEQLRRQDEKALGFHQICPRFLGFGVGELGVVKISIARRNLVGVDIAGQVFGYVAIEHDAQNIGLEVPAVDAASQIIGNGPNGAVELVPLLLFLVVSHIRCPPMLFVCLILILQSTVYRLLRVWREKPGLARLYRPFDSSLLAKNRHPALGNAPNRRSLLCRQKFHTLTSDKHLLIFIIFSYLNDSKNCFRTLNISVECRSEGNTKYHPARSASVVAPLRGSNGSE